MRNNLPQAAEGKALKVFFESDAVITAVQNSLPSHMRADVAVRYFLMEFQKNKALMRCDRNSLYFALLESAQFGLYPGSLLGHAYIIPYGDQAKLIPGYKGFIELAKRSGLVSSITARCVYKDEKFEFTAGDEEKLIHVPELVKERKDEDMVCAYAIAKQTDGYIQREVVTLAELKKTKLAAVSKLKDWQRKNAPWEEHFVPMCRKTAVRRLAKFLPMSADKLMPIDGKPSDAERFLMLNELQGKQEQEVIDINKAEELDELAEIERATVGMPEREEAEIHKQFEEKMKILSKLETKIDELHNKGNKKTDIYKFIGVKNIVQLRDLETKNLITVFQSLQSYDPKATRKGASASKPNYGDRSPESVKEVEILERLKANETISEDAKAVEYIGHFQNRFLKTNDATRIVAGIHRMQATGDSNELDALLSERPAIGV